MNDTLEDQPNMPELVIITGMSGAGRTEAMHVFEDLGYFCVDNLPASLMPNLLSLGHQTEEGTPHQLAVVCDARNGDFFGSLSQVIEELNAANLDYRVLYLDANDDKLVSRYKSSRRRHPLCSDGASIASGIARERHLLMDLKGNADYVIDTSDMLPRQLSEKIRSLFANSRRRSGLSVSVYSFGFKHGAPADADIVIDVRFLPNPYYLDELRRLTGLDDAVREYVLFREETIEFLKRWEHLLDNVMPGYVAEGKQQLAIAVGCTGGQHRSVALAEATGDFLKSKGYRVSVAHRDLEKAEVSEDDEVHYERP